MDLAIAADARSTLLRLDVTLLFSTKNKTNEAAPMRITGTYFSDNEHMSAMAAIIMMNIPSPPSKRLLDRDEP